MQDSTWLLLYTFSSLGIDFRKIEKRTYRLPYIGNFSRGFNFRWVRDQKKKDTAKNNPYYTSSLIVLEIAKIWLSENLTHFQASFSPKFPDAKNSRYTVSVGMFVEPRQTVHQKNSSTSVYPLCFLFVLWSLWLLRIYWLLVLGRYKKDYLQIIKCVSFWIHGFRDK